MTKRQLTQKEKQLTTKNLTKQKTKLQELQTLQKITQFQHDHIIPYNYTKRQKAMKITLEQLQQIQNPTPYEHWQTTQAQAYHTIGLELEHKQHLQQSQEKLDSISQEITQTQNTIKTTEKQLREGVNTK